MVTKAVQERGVSGTRVIRGKKMKKRHFLAGDRRGGLGKTGEREREWGRPYKNMSLIHINRQRANRGNGWLHE